MLCKVFSSGQLCRRWGLAAADKPSYSCLLTRLPGDTAVGDIQLRRIEQAEYHLRTLGFTAVRIRPEGNRAGIEAGPSVLNKILQPENIKTIESRFRELGFDEVVPGGGK